MPGKKVLRCKHRAHQYCQPEHRTWQSRWQRLEKELQHYNADILCLQEVCDAIGNYITSSSCSCTHIQSLQVEEPVFHEQLSPLLAQQQMQVTLFLIAEDQTTVCVHAVLQ